MFAYSMSAFHCYEFDCLFQILTVSLLCDRLYQTLSKGCLLQQTCECAISVNIIQPMSNSSQSSPSQLVAEKVDCREHAIGQADVEHHLQLSEDEDEENYEDVFEDARREAVLRSLNAENAQCDVEEKNSDLEAVLNNLSKREERKQEFAKKEEMKKLRQQNALQFFNKVRLQSLSSFRHSIAEAKEAENYAHNKLHKLLSFLTFQTLQCYHSLKSKAQNQRSRQQFEQLLCKIFKENQLSVSGNTKYASIWALAETIGIGFRKVSFIDISQMQLESFYNLKYSQLKGKPKKISKEIDILRNKLRRRATESELDNVSFVPIQSYSFSTAQSNSQPSTLSNSLTTSNFGLESQKVVQMRKTFKQSYCQIFCPKEDNWQLFNMELLQEQPMKEVKHAILEGRAIIGFYATKMLSFIEQYEALKECRVCGNLLFRDLTVDFCDKLEDVLKRRHRLGCKTLYKTIIKESNIFKTTLILTPFEQTLIQKERRSELKWATQNFPKNAKEMRTSDYFVVPSMVEKYMIIKEGVQSVPNMEFNQQKVFYRADLQSVSSRLGWIDVGRMVKDDEIPVKTTQNRNKVSTKLYKFSQTEPFKLRITDSGDFVLDEEYNSIYVPPKFDIPSEFVLIPENVDYLCKRNKYRCARVVQGFDVASAHIIPNNIGYLVEVARADEIAKMFREKQQKLKEKKDQRKVEVAMSLWRKLFKSIIITQQIHSG